MSLDEKERLHACTALALRLWESTSPVISMADLSAEVSATLNQLAERGYSTEQASHTIGSGSLLVHTDEGTFTFVHQSIMEWLVADAAASELAKTGSVPILASRPISKLMAGFFADLAGHAAIQRWASDVIGDSQLPQAAKQNALTIKYRITTPEERRLADRKTEQ